MCSYLRGVCGSTSDAGTAITSVVIGVSLVRVVDSSGCKFSKSFRGIFCSLNAISVGCSHRRLPERFRDTEGLALSKLSVYFVAIRFWPWFLMSVCTLRMLPVPFCEPFHIVRATHQTQTWKGKCRQFQWLPPLYGRIAASGTRDLYSFEYQFLNLSAMFTIASWNWCDDCVGSSLLDIKKMHNDCDCVNFVTRGNCNINLPSEYLTNIHYQIQNIRSNVFGRQGRRWLTQSQEVQLYSCHSSSERRVNALFYSLWHENENAVEDWIRETLCIYRCDILFR